MDQTGEWYGGYGVSIHHEGHEEHEGKSDRSVWKTRFAKVICFWLRALRVLRGSVSVFETLLVPKEVMSIVHLKQSN